MSANKSEESDYTRGPIARSADKLFSFCAEKQKLVIVIIVILFIVFCFMLLIKNLYNGTDIIITVMGHTIALKIHLIKRLSQFFLDIATLPLLFVTIMYTAMGNYSDNRSKEQIILSQKEHIKGLEDQKISLEKQLECLRKQSDLNHKEQLQHIEKIEKIMNVTIGENPNDDISKDRSSP